ncbi:MAG: DUF2157 domain-containing protein [Rhizobiaceae bacterium]|nr:DUF2157 domain-containing protein [Rhizobiaceae bacterium]
MAGHAARVGRDIDRWVERGLIDEATAGALRRDVERSDRSAISLGRVLSVMAAVLVAAAILIIVAANIEQVPRIARVAGLFAIIAASYIGGAVFKLRDRAGFAEALYLVGLAAFGASIALIGQMYHMSGDESEAIFIWCAAGIIAALLLRSPILTNASVLLSTAWLLTAFDLDHINQGPSFVFLLMLAAIWIVSYWTKSSAARHLVILAAMFYALLYGISDSAVLVGIVLIVLSAAVFLAAWFAPDAVERFAQLGGPQPVHPLIGFLLGIGLLQAQFADDFWPMLCLSLIAFAGIVAALVLRGRQSRLMRWVAYLAFTLELAVLYFSTIGTMVETGALFLFSGFALAIAAFAISRIERSIAARDADGRQA